MDGQMGDGAMERLQKKRAQNRRHSEEEEEIDCIFQFNSIRFDLHRIHGPIRTRWTQICCIEFNLLADPIRIELG